MLFTLITTENLVCLRITLESPDFSCTTSFVRYEINLFESRLEMTSPSVLPCLLIIFYFCGLKKTIRVAVEFLEPGCSTLIVVDFPSVECLLLNIHRCDVFVKKPAFEAEQQRESVVPWSLFSLDVSQRCERYYKRQLSLKKLSKWKFKEAQMFAELNH